MIAVKAVFVSLVIYILLTAEKPKKVPVSREQIKRVIDRLFEKRKSGGVLDKVDTAIKASNVRRYIPFMDVPVFVMLTFIVFSLTVFLGYGVTKSLPTSLVMALMGGYIPKVLLDLMSSLNTKKVRRLYLSFLNAYYGFYNLSGDLVYAFKNSADYTGEPLKSFIKEAVMKYSRSNAEFAECLDDLERKVRDKEFAKFIKFTKLHLIYGGDYRKALEKLIEQARRLEGARAMLASSSLTGTIVIFGMMILNLGSFFVAYAINPDTAEVLRETAAGQVISLGNLLAVGVGAYIAASFNR